MRLDQRPLLLLAYSLLRLTGPVSCRRCPSPQVSWCRRSGVPLKKVLIPLSYASVLGGTCTLIGTSTNLVVSARQSDRYRRSDPRNAQFRIFDIAPYGVPYAIWGFIWIVW